LSQARTTFLHYPSQSTLSPSPYVARTFGSGCPRHHWLRVMSQADWSLSLSSLAAHVKASTQAHCLHTPISLPPGGCLSAGLWGWLPPVSRPPHPSDLPCISSGFQSRGSVAIQNYMFDRQTPRGSHKQKLPALGIPSS